MAKRGHKTEHARPKKGRGAQSLSARVQLEPPAEEEPSEPQAPTPSLAGLYFRLASMVVVIVYASHGLYTGDIYIPAAGGGTHFHGLAAWVLYAAMLLVLFVAAQNVRRHNRSVAPDAQRNLKALVKIAAALCAISVFIAFLTR